MVGPAQRTTDLASFGPAASASTCQHVLSRHSPSEWEQLISKAHGDLSPSARQNPCREYLNTAEGLRLYGYSTWKVKQSFMPDVAKQVLLAVGEKGIEIVDTETIASHAVFPFNSLLKWDFPQRKTLVYFN